MSPKCISNISKFKSDQKIGAIGAIGGGGNYRGEHSSFSFQRIPFLVEKTFRTFTATHI